MNNLIVKINQAALKKDIPEFRPGDKIRLNLKVKDKDEEKERIQVFEGRVIARSGSGISETFTIRKIASGGIGVERTFPVYAPVIDKIKVLERRKVRRAKLYYIKRSGKDLKKL